MPILPGELFGRQLSKDELFEQQRFVFRLEQLTPRNYARIGRWPGAFAMTVSVLSNHVVHWVGGPWWARLAVGFCIAFAVMWWLMPRAWERAVERKWNSLEA